MGNPKTEQEILEQCDAICKEMSDALGTQWDANSNIYQEDLYFWLPTIKRTLSLVRGYRTLIDSGNYYAAISLTRLILDSGLRFASLWFVNDRRAFFKYINNGGEIRKFKDNKGKPLSDRRLVERISEYYPPIVEGAISPIITLYEDLCSIIHLNDRHIAMLKDVKHEPNSDTRVRPISIGSGEDILSEEEKVYAANNLYGTLVVVNNICKSWEQERANRPLTDVL